MSLACNYEERGKGQQNTGKLDVKKAKAKSKAKAKNQELKNVQKTYSQVGICEGCA